MAERLGLLAELQRVAVLFVGLSFDRVGVPPSKADNPGAAAGSTPAAAVTSKFSGLGISRISTSGVEKEAGEGAGVGGGTVVGGGLLGAADKDRGKEEGRGGRNVHGAAQLPPVDRSATDEAVSALSLLQGSFLLLQSIVAGHGGVIKELSVDDKGTVRLVKVAE